LYNFCQVVFEAIAGNLNLFLNFNFFLAGNQAGYSKLVASGIKFRFKLLLTTLGLNGLEGFGEATLFTILLNLEAFITLKGPNWFYQGSKNWFL